MKWNVLIKNGAWWNDDDADANPFLPWSVIHALIRIESMRAKSLPDGRYVVERTGNSYMTEYTVKPAPRPAVRPLACERDPGHAIATGLMTFLLLAWGAILWLPHVLYEQCEERMDIVEDEVEL